MIQCQKCGAQNNEKSIHCCSCGEKLDKGVVCLKCGCVCIPKDAIYCPICGKSLEEEFFNIAYSKDSITAYQNFLKKFGSGEYCKRAKYAISLKGEELKFAQEKKKEKKNEERRMVSVRNLIICILLTPIWVVLVYAIGGENDFSHILGLSPLVLLFYFFLKSTPFFDK